MLPKNRIAIRLARGGVIGSLLVSPSRPYQPLLAQYQLQLPKETLENIRNTPDFILLKPDHTDVVFVDVKYRKTLQPHRVLELANKVEQTWPGAWLFLATQDGFYFAPCAEIQSRGGAVPPLPTKWISQELQEQ